MSRMQQRTRFAQLFEPMMPSKYRDDVFRSSRASYDPCKNKIRADDKAVMASSGKRLQELIDNINRVTMVYRMIINGEKDQGNVHIAQRRSKVEDVY